MAGDTVLIPGARSVEGTLDGPDDADTLVVACPPHPQFGGNRSNRLLVEVSDAMAERGVATLRFDYGDWDEGHGEREDVRNALRWGSERYDFVGVFGYSFGGAMAALAAGTVEVPVCAVSLLAPASQVTDFDVEATVEAIDAPLQVVTGSRDNTAAWEPIAEAARAAGATVETIEGDHFFVGQGPTVAETVTGFLLANC